MAVVSRRLSSMENGNVTLDVTYDDITLLLVDIKLTNNSGGKNVVLYADTSEGAWRTVTAVTGENTLLPAGLMQTIDDLSRCAVVVG